MATRYLVILALALMCLQEIAATKRYKMVAYWGQNSVVTKYTDKERWEKQLDHFCNNFKYDVIAIAFNHILFDTRNKDSLPGLDLANHCNTPLSEEYTSLLRCPAIEKNIELCQGRGIKVLLSIGGPTASGILPSPGKAREYAHTIWNLFLGGNSYQQLRPFGKAILDGVDLNIQGGQPDNFAWFVNEIRRLMDADTSKKYLIAASPQCPFPDHFLGPSEGTAFGDSGNLFDEIYVQFYNNICSTRNPNNFWETIPKWLKFAEEAKRPKIMVGLPAADSAASNVEDFRPVNEVKAIFDKLKDHQYFAGFSIWDAGYDQNNVISGKHYSEYLVTIMSVPATTEAPTKATTTQSSEFCSGLPDGIYPNPNDCSKYITCSAGVSTVQTCPTGLLFNKITKSCDFPQNVTC